MVDRWPVHDRGILDALEVIDPEPFAGEVWRVTRKGRDPVRGTAANGPWSPSGGEFEFSIQTWNAPVRLQRSAIGSR